MVPTTVLLDALGTLVQLERPWPLLVDALARRGVVTDERLAREAMLAEIGYYRAHHDEAATREGLSDLRRRCALVLGGALGDVVAELAADEIEDAMIESLRFSAYPEVAEVLGALRARGCRLVIVSNWDISLHDVLANTGLAELVDGVVVSAQEGVAKPDARIFERALELAGAGPQDAIHVGDSVEADVAGALGAGIGAVLIDRDGQGTAVVPGAVVLAGLRGLPAVLDG